MVASNELWSFDIVIRMWKLWDIGTPGDQKPLARGAHSSVVGGSTIQEF